MKPLGPRVLLKEIKEEKVTSSGLVIPTNENQSVIKAVVVGLGNTSFSDDGVERSIDIQLEDIVLVNKYVCTEIYMDGEKYYIANLKDILMKL